MKCEVTIEDIQTINEINDFWTNKDYVQLLDLMEFPDADKVPENELMEMLFMAISDFKPPKAAEIVLTYKLSEYLSKGQIENLSHEMLEDSINEEFADISLHYLLFNINRLLYKAYNGKFPNSKASVINFKLKFTPNENIKITKAIVLKALNNGLNEKSLIKRIYSKQLVGKVKFDEAEHIIWSLEKLGDGSFSIITSDHWINDEDFASTEFEGIVNEFENKEIENK